MVKSCGRRLSGQSYYWVDVAALRLLNHYNGKGWEQEPWFICGSIPYADRKRLCERCVKRLGLLW